MTVIITAAFFALVSATILLTFYLTAAESPTSARLRGLTPRGQAEAARLKKSEGAGLLQLLATIGQYGFRGRNEKSIAQRLVTAGMRSPSALPVFYGVRTLFSFGPAIVILAPKFVSGQPMGRTLYAGLGAWALGHFGANYWLTQKSQNRIRQITEALPDVLDLLTVCLEAGLGLNAAIQRVGDERSAQGDPLGAELSQVHAELRAGRPREESLHELGTRNGSDDLRSLTAMINQSHKLGASMGQTLRAHADLLRTKRRQRAEEAARKLPIKVLIPLATLLLPPLFIVVLGPAVLRFGETVQFLATR